MQTSVEQMIFSAVEVMLSFTMSALNSLSSGSEDSYHERQSSTAYILAARDLSTDGGPLRLWGGVGLESKFVVCTTGDDG